MAERITLFKMEISDRPGSLHEILSTIAGAGLDLMCIGAVSTGEGKGAMFVSPKDVGAARAFAEQTGAAPEEMTGIVIKGKDCVGACADSLKPLADAGINGVLCMASCVNGDYVMVIAFDKANGDAAAEAYGC